MATETHFQAARYFPSLFWVAGPSLLILVGLPLVGWLVRCDPRP